MIRRWAIVGIVLLAILVGHLPANAAVAWCRGDPLVMLDGTLVDIQIELDAPPDYLLKFSGPTRYTIQKPAAVAHVLVPTEDIGTNPHGATVRFTDGGTVEARSFPVTIDVVVPLGHHPGEGIPTTLTVYILNGEEAGKKYKCPAQATLPPCSSPLRGPTSLTRDPPICLKQGAEQCGMLLYAWHS
jgi:hypothetical protein